MKGKGSPGEGIRARSLTREFKRQRRRPGIGGAVRALFAPEYDVLTAVDRVSFEIEPGEVVGYIGPNGAGKSTTVKMLVGILVPTGGDVSVGGIVPHRQRVANARNIGVVFGQRTQLWWDIPVSDTFKVMRHVYDIPLADFERTLARFHDMLAIGEFADVAVRQLSLGQRMRADFCCAMLHDPDFLFLDEPTIGLDVVAKEQIRQFIREINRTHGKTVILTTHDMGDIEKLCDRVIVIDKGRIMYDGDLDALKRRYAADSVITADVRGKIWNRSRLEAAGAKSVAVRDGTVTITFDPARATAAALVGELLRGNEVRDFSTEEPEIEHVIRNLYASL